MSSSLSSMPSSLPPDSRQRVERERCRRSLAHFADRHCRILASKDEGGWVPFRLWPDQRPVADAMERHRLIVMLKARQVGMTWLALARALHRMLFFPVATVLLFSRRDDEAVELLAQRLRGMYERLPEWLRPATVMGNDHEWELANGSRALAFPCNAGDSYTGTLAVCDEFDLLSDKEQLRLLGAVKPTIDGGGQMILLSRPDKGRPESPFKKIYRDARQGKSPWQPVFLPWTARPDRDAAWYADQRTHSLTLGSLDWVHEQYPETDVEALSPRTLDKRLAPAWLQAVYDGLAPLDDPFGEFPSIPGLTVFRVPERGRRYVIGGDTAEGNPQSDDSAAEVLDEESGEQVASLAGRFEPSVFAAHVDTLSRWYDSAPALIERNNHGHAVLLWLADNSPVQLLHGADDRPGWLTSSLGKARMYDGAADQVRGGEVTVHGLATFVQLASIEGSTLAAPPGQKDDRATAYVLACVARLLARQGTGEIGFEPARQTHVGAMPQQW